jgi:hypothetical protein
MTALRARALVRDSPGLTDGSQAAAHSRDLRHTTGQIEHGDLTLARSRARIVVLGVVDLPEEQATFWDDIHRVLWTSSERHAEVEQGQSPIRARTVFRVHLRAD